MNIKEICNKIKDIDYQRYLKEFPPWDFRYVNDWLEDIKPIIFDKNFSDYFIDFFDTLTAIYKNHTISSTVNTFFSLYLYFNANEKTLCFDLLKEIENDKGNFIYHNKYNIQAALIISLKRYLEFIIASGYHNTHFFMISDYEDEINRIITFCNQLNSDLDSWFYQLALMINNKLRKLDSLNFNQCILQICREIEEKREIYNFSTIMEYSYFRKSNSHIKRLFESLLISELDGIDFLGRQFFKLCRDLNFADTYNDLWDEFTDLLDEFSVEGKAFNLFIADYKIKNLYGSLAQLLYPELRIDKEAQEKLDKMKYEIPIKIITEIPKELYQKIEDEFYTELPNQISKNELKDLPKELLQEVLKALPDEAFYKENEDQELMVNEIKKQIIDHSIHPEWAEILIKEGVINVSAKDQSKYIWLGRNYFLIHTLWYDYINTFDDITFTTFCNLFLKKDGLSPVDHTYINKNKSNSKHLEFSRKITDKLQKLIDTL